ncbi:hypothetical protein GCM10010435_67930 [Winogradskya consettensis]|uniref:HEAT repeat domain-containing protein n=1 Tax=Winogradskya consettensis TaxID=113560 RepID=A0A919VSD6_9ACTN|nr:hypothetical protein [Actinoplanes consettensis]GIM73735.1 hypothetical protein Aco04nite_36840 [Actinoplanes consettensis]
MTRPASPTKWEWLEAAITSGEVLLPGSESRSHIFHFIRADRNGPLTDRLLTFTTHHRASVRRTALTLLDELSFQEPGWPVVADNVALALKDVDPPVRRTAATLPARTAEPARAMAALHSSTDPDVRIALVDAIAWDDVPQGHDVLERLRSDPVPGVRLLATLAMMGKDSAALDASVRADLEVCAGVLDAPGSRLALTPGQRWARALNGLDREEDCYAWVGRLTSPAERTPMRVEGVRMAVEAMRQWRAAPDRLTPTLTGLLNAEDVRPAALHALAASLTASRLAADDLVATLDDPQLGTVAAVALGSIGDHRALPQLVRLMVAGSDDPRLLEAFRAVAAAGADPREPVAAVRQILAALPASCAPEMPMRVLAAFGPGSAAAVPELIARLQGAENDTPDWAIHVLRRIGPGAAAAVPELLRYPIQSAVFALLTITSDREVADRYLAARPEQPHRGRAASAMLTWIAEHGHAGLTARQHRQLRSLFGVPGAGQVESARALWMHEGPGVAAELLEVLPEYLSDDVYAPEVLRVFAEMEPYARPVLDRLDRWVAGRRRAGFHIGDADAAMRTDERVHAAMTASRKRITG